MDVKLSVYLNRRVFVIRSDCAFAKSSLGTFWLDKDSKLLHADKEGSDQIAAQNSRRIRVFVGHTCQKMHFTKIWCGVYVDKGRLCFQTRVWLIVCAVSMLFGPVVVKSWRVYQIFKYGAVKRVVCIYSKTSLTRTPTNHLPRLIRFRSWSPWEIFPITDGKTNI